MATINKDLFDRFGNFRGYLKCLGSTSNEAITTISLYHSSNKSISTIQEPISQGELDIQFNIATTHTAFGLDEKTFEWRLTDLRSRRDAIFGYIAALAVLMLELIKLTFYIIEMQVIIWFMLVFIPEIFFKIRDRMVDNYLKRTAT